MTTILEALQAQNGETGETFVELSASGPTEIRGGEDVLLSDFARLGPDLQITLPSGETVVVIDYFAAGADAPSLVTDGGSTIGPTLVEKLAGPMVPDAQIAQTGTSEVLGEPAGSVDSIKGSVVAVRGGVDVALGAGDPIYEGDVLVSGPGAAVGIVFSDDSTMSMGGNGRIAIDEMVYNPDSGSGSQLFDVVQGAFVFASGQIGKTNPEDVAVRTPVATIGIRGTKYAVNVDQVSQEATITLFEGAVVVENGAGQVLLNSIGQSTQVTSAFTPPGDVFIMEPDVQSTIYGDAIDFHPDAGLGRGEEEEDGGGSDVDGEEQAIDPNDLSADELEDLAEELDDLDTAAGPSGAIAILTQSTLFLRILNTELNNEEFFATFVVDDDDTGTREEINTIDDDPPPETVLIEVPDPVQTQVSVRLSDDGGREEFSFFGSVVTLEVTGGTGFDLIAINAAGLSQTTRWTITQDENGNVVLREAGTGRTVTLDEVEELELTLGNLSDVIEIGDLTGTDISESTIFLSGGGGNDLLDASDAGKRLVAIGGAGDDTIIGGTSNDDISGGAGNDTLDGGNGFDRLLGGTGNDLFRVSLGDTAKSLGSDVADKDTRREDERFLFADDSAAAAARTVEVIQGGADTDTLELTVTAAQLENPDIVAALLALQTSIEQGTGPYQSDLLALDVQSIEALTLVGVPALPSVATANSLSIDAEGERASLDLSPTTAFNTALFAFTVSIAALPVGATVAFGASSYTVSQGDDVLTLSLGSTTGGDAAVGFTATAVDLAGITIDLPDGLGGSTLELNISTVLTNRLTGAEESGPPTALAVDVPSDVLTVTLPDEGGRAEVTLDDSVAGAEVEGGAGEDLLAIDTTEADSESDWTISRKDDNSVRFDDAISKKFVVLDEVEAVELTLGDKDDRVTVGNLTGTDIADETVYLAGNEGDDFFDASEASKRLVASGGGGDDVIIGGSGNDDLSGGSGDDLLIGGAGNDRMLGGEGNDTFQITLGQTSVSDAPVTSSPSLALDPFTFARNASDAAQSGTVIIEGGDGSDTLSITVTDEQLGNADFLEALIDLKTSVAGGIGGFNSTVLGLDVSGVEDVAIAATFPSPILTTANAVDVSIGAEEFFLDLSLSDAPNTLLFDTVIEITGLPIGATITFNGVTFPVTDEAFEMKVVADAAQAGSGGTGLPLVSAGELSDLIVQFAENSVPSDFQIGVTTTATNRLTGEVAMGEAGSILVDLPVVLTSEDVVGLEDVAIALNIDLENIGVEATGTVILEGLPEGAVLLNTANETFTGSPIELTLEQLEGLSATLPDHNSDDFTLAITAVIQDGEETLTLSDTMDVKVLAVADVPSLAVSTLAFDDTVGAEEGLVKASFSVDVGTLDQDGSEVLSVTISGLPEGVGLAIGGFEIVNGQPITLAADILDDLSLSLPRTTEPFELVIAAQSIDIDGDFDTDVATSEITVAVAPDADGGWTTDVVTGTLANDVIEVVLDAPIRVDGEAGTDTLKVVVTPLQLNDTDAVAELVALRAFVNSGAAADGQQTFDTLGLTVSNVEAVQIVDADGNPVDLAAALVDVTTGDRDSAIMLSGADDSGIDVDEVRDLASTVTLPLIVQAAVFAGAATLEVLVDGVSLGTFEVTGNIANGFQSIDVGNVTVDSGEPSTVELRVDGVVGTVAVQSVTFGDGVLETAPQAFEGDYALLGALDGTLDFTIEAPALDGFVVDRDEGQSAATAETVDAVFGAVDAAEGDDWAIASAGVNANLDIDLSDEAWAGVENVLGGAGDDVLEGDEAVNLLAGRSGDDLLIAGSDGDILLGGSGNDTAVLDVGALASEGDDYDGSLDAAIREAYAANDLDGAAALEDLAAGFNGGSGTDTLRLLGGDGGDVTLAGDALANAIANIEILDVTGIDGTVGMSLSVDDLMEMTDEGDALTILKDGGDSVVVEGQEYGVGEHTIDIGGADFKLNIAETDPTPEVS